MKLNLSWCFGLACLMAAFTFSAFGAPSHGVATVADSEVERLPELHVQDFRVHPERAHWSFAKSGDVEVLTDLGPKVARECATDVDLFLAFARARFPEAALPRGTHVRVMLDTGYHRLFAPALVTAGLVLQPTEIGIYLRLEVYTERENRIVERELTKAALHSNARLPLWYRLALKNILAHARVLHGEVTLGYPPFTTPGGRFLLTGVAFLPWERVFALREGSSDFKDAELRWRLERQATAFAHVCMFYRHGYYAASLGTFLQDPASTTDVPAAFERAFGFELGGAGHLVRSATDPAIDYPYEVERVTATEVTEVEEHAPTGAEVERFRVLLGRPD